MRHYERAADRSHAGIGACPERGRQVQLFEERNQIHMSLLEDGTLREVHLIHHEVGLIKVERIEAAADSRQFRQEAADQPVRFLSEPQVGWICRSSIGWSDVMDSRAISCVMC